MDTELILATPARRRPIFAVAAGLLLASLAGCSTTPDAADQMKGIATLTPNPPQRVVVDGIEGLRAAVGDRTYFDYDSAIVRQDSLPMLRNVAAWMKQHPSVRIIIEGHADEHGTREYNLALGARRAEALQKVLAALDVSKSQLAGTVSYGKERPAVVGSTESAWAQNRRAVMTIE